MIHLRFKLKAAKILVLRLGGNINIKIIKCGLVKMQRFLRDLETNSSLGAYLGL